MFYTWGGVFFGISTAMKAALYYCFDGPLAPLNGHFMAKVDHNNRPKQINLLMVPSIPHICLFFYTTQFEVWKFYT